MLLKNQKTVIKISRPVIYFTEEVKNTFKKADSFARK